MKVVTKKLHKHLTCRCYPLFFQGNCNVHIIFQTMRNQIYLKLDVHLIAVRRKEECLWFKVTIMHSRDSQLCLLKKKLLYYLVASMELNCAYFSNPLPTNLSARGLRTCVHFFNQTTKRWCRFSETKLFNSIPHALGTSWRQNLELEQRGSNTKLPMM